MEEFVRPIFDPVGTEDKKTKTQKKARRKTFFRIKTGDRFIGMKSLFDLGSHGIHEDDITAPGVFDATPQRKSITGGFRLTLLWAMKPTAHV